MGAVNICRNRCTGACFHGAILQYFYNISGGTGYDTKGSTFSGSDLRPYFLALCNGNDELSRAISLYYSIGDCYHSLGHVAMNIARNEFQVAMQGAIVLWSISFIKGASY